MRLFAILLLLLPATLAAQVAPIEVRDIAYGPTGSPAAVMDLYRQPGAAPAPVLIYYHGGAWAAGARPKAASSFRAFLGLGFSVLSVDYRLAAEAPAPAAVQDARCAVKWVQRHAAEYGFDTTRIVTYGTSAGGQLALMAAMLPATWERDLPQCAGIPRVAAVLDFYGPADVRGFAKKSARTREWLGTGGEAMATEMSPITRVRAGLPPVLIVHGDADPTVPYAQSLALRDSLARAGVTVRMHTVPGGEHGKFSDEAKREVNRAAAGFLRELGIVAR